MSRRLKDLLCGVCSYYVDLSKFFGSAEESYQGNNRDGIISDAQFTAFFISMISLIFPTTIAQFQFSISHILHRRFPLARHDSTRLTTMQHFAPSFSQASSVPILLHFSSLQPFNYDMFPSFCPTLLLPPQKNLVLIHHPHRVFCYRRQLPLAL